mgnify:CR=1 FL=1
MQFGSACDHRSWDGYQRGDDGLAAVELEHVAPGAAHSVLGCSTIFAASAIPGAPPVSQINPGTSLDCRISPTLAGWDHVC